MGGFSNTPSYDDPDLLAQLMGGKIGGVNNDRTPPYPLVMQPQPAAGAPTAMPAAPVAKVSDDPAVTGLPAIPQPPKLMGPNMGDVQSLADQIRAKSQPIQRSDYKPSIWQRILSPVVAGIQGFGDADKGIKAGNELLSRNYDRAVGAQKAELDPLYKQMDTQEKMLPFYKQGNETAQGQFSDQMKGVTEAREQMTAKSNANYKSDIADLRQQVANNHAEEATRRLQDMEDKAKNDSGYRMQMLQQREEIVGIRQQLADAATTRANKGATGTPAGSRLIETKKQAALDKAESEYAGTIRDLDSLQKTMKLRGKGAVDDSADRQGALATLNEKKQRAQDAYEAEIAAAGGEPSHLNVNKSGAQATPASGGKSVAKSVVQSYADAHKMDYATALRGFQSKGYAVQ